MTAIRPDEFCFFVLNKKSDWEEGGADDNIEITDDGIQLKGISAHTAGRTIESRAFRKDITVVDFAAGQCGLIYILDKLTRSVLVYDPDQDLFEPVAGSGGLFSPTSITLTPGTLYIASRSGPYRIIALSLATQERKWTITGSKDTDRKDLPELGDFSPIDLAVDPDGNLFALDVINSAIVEFDQAGRFVRALRQDDLKNRNQATIARSSDGTLYVLDPESKTVWSAASNGELEKAFTVSEIYPSSLGIDRSGKLYIGDGRKSVDPGEEDDRFIRRFDPDGSYLGEVSGYRGSAEKLLVDSADRIYVFGGREPEIEANSFIVLNLVTRFVPLGQRPPSAGTYFSRAFDSTTSGTQWHRLVLDADIRDNTQVRVSYHIAEDKKTPQDIPDLDWIPLRTNPRDALIQRPAGRTNPRDALIQSPAGRYLWLRLNLTGSETQTPHVRSVRVYFPRISYLRYLPAVYQQDQRSRDFLERFLSLFETLLSGFEREVDHVARYFDAHATPAGFVRWLASWLGIAADENWPAEKLRMLIGTAPELYKNRGTRYGMEAIIEIFTGERPIIIEHFQICCDQYPEANQEYAKLFGEDAYCFWVILKPYQVRSEEERAAVRRIVDAEKPAHTCAELLQLRPRIRLDIHTYLGENTYLVGEARLDEGAALSMGSVLL